MEARTQAPLLSVTVLNYNYGHFIHKSLDSILSQDFKDFEVILINDKSTDNSLEIIEPYLKDKRIRLIDHQTNKGFVASLIEGVELSRGEFITVISADDWVLEPTAFQQQMDLVMQDPEIAFVFTAYGHFDKGENLGYIWRDGYESYIKSGFEGFKDLVLNPYLLHTGTVIRKSAYYASGGYDSSYKFSVDTKMWLGLCHVGKIAYINECLYAYRRHGNNMSKNVNSLLRASEEVLKSIEWSFSSWSDEEKKNLRGLQAKAERKVLTAFVIDDVFGDNYRAGWYTYWVALKLRPFQTLFQKNTLILVFRTLLRKRGYSALERFKALFNSRTRQRLALHAMDKSLRKASK